MNLHEGAKGGSVRLDNLEIAQLRPPQRKRALMNRLSAVEHCQLDALDFAVGKERTDRIYDLASKLVGDTRLNHFVARHPLDQDLHTLLRRIYPAEMEDLSMFDAARALVVLEPDGLYRPGKATLRRSVRCTTNVVDYCLKMPDALWGLPPKKAFDVLYRQCLGTSDRIDLRNVLSTIERRRAYLAFIELIERRDIIEECRAAISDDPAAFAADYFDVFGKPLEHPDAVRIDIHPSGIILHLHEEDFSQVNGLRHKEDPLRTVRPELFRLVTAICPQAYAFQDRRYALSQLIVPAFFKESSYSPDSFMKDLEAAPRDHTESGGSLTAFHRDAAAKIIRELKERCRKEIVARRGAAPLEVPRAALIQAGFREYYQALVEHAGNRGEKDGLQRIALIYDDALSDYLKWERELRLGVRVLLDSSAMRDNGGRRELSDETLAALTLTPVDELQRRINRLTGMTKQEYCQAVNKARDEVRQTIEAAIGARKENQAETSACKPGKKQGAEQLDQQSGGGLLGRVKQAVKACGLMLRRNVTGFLHGPAPKQQIHELKNALRRTTRQKAAELGITSPIEQQHLLPRFLVGSAEASLPETARYVPAILSACLDDDELFLGLCVVEDLLLSEGTMAFTADESERIQRITENWLNTVPARNDESRLHLANYYEIIREALDAAMRGESAALALLSADRHRL